MPYRTFVAGEEALADPLNTHLMSQTVARFTNAAQRTSLLPAPSLNQLSMLDDRPGSLQFWNGSAWAEAGDAWKAYTPTFHGDSGVSTLGNGVLTGKYRTDGKMVMGNLYLRLGTTTVLNPGAIRLGLPLPHAAFTDPPILGPAGALLSNGYWSFGYLLPSSTSQVVMMGPYIVSNGNVAIYNNANISGSGNFINAAFTYETT